MTLAGYGARSGFLRVKMGKTEEKAAAESVKTIEKFINCCLIKGSCVDCPFYQEGKYYLSGRCMGAKEYGTLLLAFMADIKKVLKVK